MRVFGICLLLVITLAACDSADLAGPPDKVKMKLIYPASDALKPSAFVIYQYDGNNRLIKESYVQYPSSLEHYYTYTYENNRLATKRYYLRDTHVESAFENDIPLAETTNYFYQGNLLSGEEVTHDNELVSARQYFYNENGLLTRENWLGPTREVIRFTEYTYNEDGRKIAESNSDGTVTKYDYESGKLSLVKKQGANGTVIESQRFTYNSDGLLLERTMNDTILAQKNRYRDSNLVEEIIYHPTYQKTEWQVFRYKY